MFTNFDQQSPRRRHHFGLRQIPLYDESTKESRVKVKKDEDYHLPGGCYFLFQKSSFKIGNHRFSQGGPQWVV